MVGTRRRERTAVGQRHARVGRRHRAQHAEWIAAGRCRGGTRAGARATALRRPQPRRHHAGNLEGTLSVGGPSKCSSIGGSQCFAFQAPPSTAGQLRSLGFELVNQANNHSLDYGESGRVQTISALEHAGIAHTGLPGEITVLRAGGTRVAFLGFAPYSYDSDLLDIPGAQALVRAARKRAQLVIVYHSCRGRGRWSAAHAERRGVLPRRGSWQCEGVRARRDQCRSSCRVRLGAARDPWHRAVPRPADRLLARELRRLPHACRRRPVVGERDPARHARPDRARAGGPMVLDQAVRRASAAGPSNASAKLVGPLSGEDFRADHFRISPTGVFELPRREKPGPAGLSYGLTKEAGLREAAASSQSTDERFGSRAPSACTSRLAARPSSIWPATT